MGMTSRLRFNQPTQLIVVEGTGMSSTAARELSRARPGLAFPPPALFTRIDHHRQSQRSCLQIARDGEAASSRLCFDASPSRSRAP